MQCTVVLCKITVSLLFLKVWIENWLNMTILGFDAVLALTLFLLCSVLDAEGSEKEDVQSESLGTLPAQLFGLGLEINVCNPKPAVEICRVNVPKS